MIFLILSFLLNVGILSLFHLFPKYRIDTFQAIVFNYIVCVITGLLFVGGFEPVLISEIRPWMPIALILGGIFIGTFYLMAITTQRYGISVSSIASKMSLAIPVVFALFIFDIESKDFNTWNYLGLFLAMVAIYLSSYKSQDQQTHAHGKGLSWLILPAFVFVFGGIIDTTINYTNYKFLTTEDTPVFPIYTFASASLVGIVVISIRKKRIRFSSIFGGVFLGVINYFSIYFLLGALTAFQNDGAVVYPVLNMLIILGSALVSISLFGEKLESRNKVGLLLSFLAIFLISHQEIINLINP
jgi:drug/metabolite transporter (DMT)-like permease